ncbi:MAG: hypothetical protein WD767_05410 [Alphaproteobacteria bacterium]
MAFIDGSTDTFKVWVEFDGFGDPQRAAWGVRPPESSVIQIETPDMSTARRATAALKATIRHRHSLSPALGACLSGEY